MGLDIRFPIGIILTIYGLILAVYGVTVDPLIPVTDPVIAQNVSQVDIDLWWGVAMLAFGLFMGILALRASRRNVS